MHCDWQCIKMSYRSNDDKGRLVSLLLPAKNTHALSTTESSKSGQKLDLPKWQDAGGGAKIWYIPDQQI